MDIHRQIVTSHGKPNLQCKSLKLNEQVIQLFTPQYPKFIFYVLEIEFKTAGML